MAIIKTTTKSITAIDGGSMEKSAELGVLFGCHKGVCGKCATDVLSGMSNLSAPSDAEKAMDLGPARRLMCQCVVKRGTVKLDLP